MSLLSMTCPVLAEPDSSTGRSATTSTCSLATCGCSVKSSSTRWPTPTFTSWKMVLRKPLSSAVTR
jgi:hypothetical protein